MSEDELAVHEEPEAAPEMEESAEAAVVEAEAALSEASLILKRAGAETAEVFPLHPPSIVGRFDPAVGPIDVDLGSLPEGQYISRKHAKITFEEGVWTLHDLGSSNGTFILRADFERIEEAELADGDEIAFGNARFVFRMSAPGDQAEEISIAEPSGEEQEVENIEPAQ